MDYLILGNFLLPIFIIFINQNIIASTLKNKYPEKHKNITKDRFNYHTIAFSKFLYSIKNEEDPKLKKLKLINIFMFFYFLLSFIVMIII